MRESRERIQRMATSIVGTKVNWYMANHHTGQVSSTNQASKYTLSQIMSYTDTPSFDTIDFLWFIGHMACTRMVLHSYTKVELVDESVMHPLTGVKESDEDGVRTRRT
eukprot:GHVP01071067.1.p1 GENE.GHVP01071067.1~~GHVP01071067.1.p1  ORF type:complete len:127 (-),score=6.26 GHVP01071067.1:44-367(-)